MTLLIRAMSTASFVIFFVSLLRAYNTHSWGAMCIGVIAGLTWVILLLLNLMTETLVDVEEPLRERIAELQDAIDRIGTRPL